MRRSHLQDGESGVAVNLTPMLDMAFILLIFFIVTASFTREQGVPVQRPAASSAEPLDEEHTLVTLDAAGQTWVDGRAVPLELLRRALAPLGEGGARAARVVVVADRQAPTGLLIQVVDAARLAGVRQVGVAAREP